MSIRAAERTLPWDWYVDPGVLRLEQERLFRRSWQYAARLDQVAEPGQFVATRVGDVPVVLVRDQERRLRGFVNVCRHRGALVCEGEGIRETLQCPYHAWTYGLDGSLHAAPRAEREPGFDRGELALVGVAVETWGPLVFVNPGPEAPPLADHLGELPALLEQGGIDVDALVFHRRVEGEYEANWKLCAENYLECYHCAVAHPSFAQAIDVAPGAYELRASDSLASQFAAAREHGGGVYDAEGEIARAQFHYLFPSTVLNVMPGRPNLSIGPIVPLATGRTYRFLDYFFGRDAEEPWIADYLALDDRVGHEDRLLVERVQRGVRCGLVQHGRLLPESEQLIAWFRDRIVYALAG